MPLFNNLLNDFVSLIYPACCLGCERLLKKNEGKICTKCRLDLPKSFYHLNPNNTVAKRFWGKVNLKYAMAYFIYSKKSIVQNLLHNLKYHDHSELGEILGKWYGSDLLETGFDMYFDLIVPVPLHLKRQKERGYNQSDGFAKGLSEILNIEWKPEVLQRVKANTTQTKKSRFERWKNVNEIFNVKYEHQVLNKNILLVDDVITTGATLEACAKKIIESKCKSVSIATIAAP